VSLLSTCIAVAAGSVQAVPVSITNSSFEDPDLGDGLFTGDFTAVTGWTGSGGVNAFQTGVQESNDVKYTGTTGNNPLPGTGDSLQFAYVQSGNHTITTTSSLGAVAPNTLYKLTVAVGDPLNEPTNNIYTLALLDNGTAISTAIAPTAPSNGTFVDASLTFLTGSTVNGGPLAIRLGNGGGSQVNFDNVRLEATPVTFVPVAVANGSFELPNLNDGAFTGDFSTVPGWVGSGGANTFVTGIQDSNDVKYAGTTGDNPLPATGDGFQFAYVQGGTQAITTTSDLGLVAPNTTYVLTVAVGDPLNEPTNTAYLLSLLDSGIAFASITAPTALVNGDFVDATLIFTTGNTVTGGSLAIRLGNGGGSQVNFDNVRLAIAVAAAAVPEPATAALGLMGIAGLMMRRRYRAM